MSEAQEHGRREPQEEVQKEEAQERYVAGVDLSTTEDKSVMTIVKHRSLGYTQIALAHHHIDSCHEQYSPNEGSFVKFPARDTDACGFPVTQKKSFDLNECVYNNFSVEHINRLCHRKTKILVISANKRQAEQRAKLIYSLMARQVTQPQYNKIVLKNGTSIRFITDYDELGTYEPEHVFE